MDEDKLWNDFMQTGSVDSYLAYARTGTENRKANADENRGFDNQSNQIR